jgi:murein DD-endopeptidase MepM/ murein hydrolase activator NlpD
VPEIPVLKNNFLVPIAGQLYISSGIGNRMLNGKPEFHKGIDFSVPIGKEIRAIEAGLIFKAGYENPNDIKQGFGLRIWQEIVVENEKYYVWYGHTSELKVKEGSIVKRGDVIALSGNSGSSTGPHLHVQIRKKNTNQIYGMEFKEA